MTAYLAGVALLAVSLAVAAGAYLAGSSGVPAALAFALALLAFYVGLVLVARGARHLDRGAL